MTELLKLIKKRGSVKAKVTIFQRAITNLTAELPDEATELPSAVKAELQQRFLRTSSHVLNEFDAIQEEIDGLVDDEDHRFRERENFEKEYFTAVAAARRLLSRGQANRQEQQAQHAGQDQQARIGGQQNRATVKLPVIELPKFSGQLSEWLWFRDSFQSLVHTRQTLDDIEKFHYLRAALEGNAEQIIKSLDLSAANYTVAWDALCSRYNNDRLLIHNHIKALFKIENTTKETPGQIRKILDTLNKHLRALTTLKQPTESWDSLLIYLIVSKLDSNTAREWEKDRTAAVPTLEQFKTFLTSRADFLETLELSQSQYEKGSQSKSKDAAHSKTKSFVTEQKGCILCKESHYVQNCPELLKLSPQERAERIKSTKACLNCLKTGHFIKDCKAGSCKRCKAKHNTLLHFDRTESTETKTQSTSQDTTALATRYVNIREQVLLPTASVYVKNRIGVGTKARVLLDPCSQSSFVAMEFCETLKLAKIPFKTTIGSLNDTTSNSNYKCEVHMVSLDGKFAIDLTCVVVPKITSTLPNFCVDLNELQIPSHLKLADPLFHEPANTDILLGAEHFWNLLCVGQIKIGKSGGDPLMQKTRLGWIIAGPMIGKQSATIQCNFSKQAGVEQQLRRFWELEEYPGDKLQSNEEQACEKHFLENTNRATDGRFIVSIPFKESISKLGDSKITATRRFKNLEQKLNRDPVMKAEYVAFLSEYESLGHMSSIEDEALAKYSYYLPHHGVVREQSLSTKLRVVFDGSAPTTTGISLNELQMVGPTIQNDLFAITLRFRKHPYIISADIEKMYRQVLVSPEQRSLQRILWRQNANEKIQTYELNTVTYGTASASFLSIRCLMQLAIECEHDYPEIAKVIRNDFYVDHLLTGSDSIEKTVSIAKQVSKIISRGGFILRKWVSNEPIVTQRILTADNSLSIVNLCKDGQVKTLGLIWQATTDSLTYSVNITKDTKVTKRQILSEIAQIFDPMGLLGPCIIIAKILLKKLWLEKLSWDESLPAQLNSQWLEYKSQLNCLNNLEIPRQILCKCSINIQLHGFSDASENAYGACVYVRSEDAEKNVRVSVLCSKTRVSPVKTQSIPRLELCGALVLAQLVSKVRTAIDMRIDEITFWTDSTIVLAWLRTEPHRLQTFVSNRVAKIQELTDCDQWRHVPTRDNPADHLSRGIKPNNFAGCELWHAGPNWLSSPKDLWPSTPSLDTPLDMKKSFALSNTPLSVSDSIFEVIPTLARLVRMTVSCQRFVKYWKDSTQNVNESIHPQEFERALITLAKLSQERHFANEIVALKRGISVGSKNSISALNPFVDDEGILRVGGRLNNSEFVLDKKHPILLSSQHQFTKLLFRHEHELLLHSGPQMLLASLRERFWPLGGRNLARKTVRDCLTCAKANPQPMQTMMGSLPKARVTKSPPFTISGVDYAGPLLIKDRKGRGSKTSKCWVALFICFSTKAIHLELVTDLTKDAFIAALRRFASRRGKPAHIYSDNGTNFVSANNELKALNEFLTKESSSLTESIENLGITWHFIPPSSPHFGGLWEAGVKSTKHHLKRVAGNASLTFEELYTLLVQIEALLNSRPITPLSADPNDLTPLTPAHFLIGRTLTSVVDPDVTHIPESRLSRWQHVQQLNQHLWTRWSKEYISELQRRSKWKAPFPPLQENAIVIIKEDNLPPAKWKLGRVISLHPGSDNICRVASIKTSSGVVRRALTKLCPLPIEIADVNE